MLNVYLCGDSVHDNVLQAFYDGAPGPKQLLRVENYEPSDVGVVFGILKRAVPYSQYRGKVIREQIAHRAKVVVLETGYVNRGDGPEHHYAAGLGGLNNRADFRNQLSPIDRWKKLGVHPAPWHKPDPHKPILLCGQVPWDASVEHIVMENWLVNTAKTLRRYSGREIVFRPHPKAHMSIRGLRESTGPVEWADYHAVVTFNSNIAVEAVIAGVPAFVDDIGSMALAVSNRSLADIESPKYPDRTQWLADLAYTQWTPREFREGLAWKHLFDEPADRL